MQEADIRVQHAGHRLAGRLGVTMRNRERVILVQADDDAGVDVAEMIDQTVVEPAIARAGVEADIGDAEPAQHLRRDVAAPGYPVVRFSFDFIQVHRSPRSRNRLACAKPGQSGFSIRDGRRSAQSPAFALRSPRSANLWHATTGWRSNASYRAAGHA